MLDIVKADLGPDASACDQVYFSGILSTLSAPSLVDANIKWEGGHGNAFDILAGGDGDAGYISTEDIRIVKDKIAAGDLAATALLAEMDRSTSIKSTNGPKGMKLLDYLANNHERISAAKENRYDIPDTGDNKFESAKLGISRGDLSAL